MHSNILVPLDGSRVGENALPWALQSARRSDAIIHLLQVVPRRRDLGLDGRIFSTPAEHSYAMVRGWSNGGIGGAIDYLAIVAANLRVEGVRVRTAIHEGHATERILTYAMVNAIDLIVAGTRGDGGWTRIARLLRSPFRPSVCGGIRAESQIPVMLCHRDDGYIFRMDRTATILSARFLAGREIVLEVDLPSKFRKSEPEASPASIAFEPIDAASRNGNGVRLTNREVEVLRLVAAGRSNIEIADLLFISAHTVSHHVSNILEKMAASNRAEAAVTAARLGILGDNGIAARRGGARAESGPVIHG